MLHHRGTNKFFFDFIDELRNIDLRQAGIQKKIFFTDFLAVEASRQGWQAKKKFLMHGAAVHEAVVLLHKAEMDKMMEI